ncbi:MAG: hypothetical protein ABSG46_20625 [Candidatus Binataceae bacterium]|jgi:hypothetical protein
MSNTELAVIERTEESVTISPYRAAQLVNEMFRELGLTKQIPPQMIYTYVRKGYITATDRRIDRQSFETWARPYIERTAKRAMKTA